MTNRIAEIDAELDALQDAIDEQNRLIRLLIAVVGMLVLVLGVVVAL